MGLRTLGGLSFEGVGFSRPKPLLLLTYLAMEGPRDRRYLAELLWPRAANPRQSLSVALSQLRHAAPAALVEDGARLKAEVECDAALLLAAARDHEWQAVVDLYAGPFLSGVDVDEGNVELEEWLFHAREAVAGRAQQALITLSEHALVEGDLPTAAHLANRAATLLPEVADIDPGLIARLHALLIAADDPRALNLRREAEELGIELPLTASPPPVTPAPRLTTHNLPRQLAPLVGRAEELAGLRELLDEGARLVTITGLGGDGKTRLALELARRLQAEAAFDPLYFVALETTTDPDQVLDQIATTARLSAGSSDPVRLLRSRFDGSKALFVLDNFEQLTAAAPRLLDLLDACPDLRLLVTSRVPLGVAGEALYPISGLPLPPSAAAALAEGARFDALELFTLAARRHDPRFRLTSENAAAVVEVCGRLAGSPLGISLAAALTRVMPVSDLALELRSDLDALVSVDGHLPERHASLRTVFERSWERLGERQRAALAGAAIFEGGFDRAAAREVLSLDLPLLATLIDTSLLARRGARYDLHPLMKQYAAEKLAALPEAEELRAKHARYFAEFLVSKRPAYRRVGNRVAFEELDRDYPNIRGAWEWAVGRREWSLLDEMVTMFADYLWVRKRYGELTARVNQALEQVAPGSLLAGRLSLALALASMDSEPLTAIPLLERAQRLGERHGDDGLVAYALYRLGRATASLGDQRLALEHYAAALPLLERCDDGMSYGGCLCNLGLVTYDSKEKGALLERAAAASRRSGNSMDLANILNNLACHVRDTDGDYPRALSLMREAIELEEAELGRRHQLILHHEWAAYYCVQARDFQAATEHLDQAGRLVAERETWQEAVTAQTESHWTLAHYHYALGESELGLEHARAAAGYGDCYPLLTWAAVTRGDLGEAVRFRDEFGAALELADGYGPAVVANYHLMNAAIAVLSLAAEEPAAEAASRDLREVAVDELLLATDLITTHGLLPRALHAFSVGHLVAPRLVGRDLLELAASHPCSPGVSRRLASQRLGTLAAPAAAADGQAAAAAPPLDKRAVLEKVRRLAARLRAERSGNAAAQATG